MTLELDRVVPSITFSYHGHEITVDSEGRVAVEQRKPAPAEPVD